MPYQVQQLIQGRGFPVCVKKDDAVSKALSLMIEYDFSQLPVIKNEGNYNIPEGMITYEGILRGIRNFKANIEELKVRDVMVAAPIYDLEDDLFDILDRLKDTNAVLVAVNGVDLWGIVTSYDTTEYFRDRTEDLMRVEEIELMVKEFIKAAYIQESGEIDWAKLNLTIQKATSYTNKENVLPKKAKNFDDLNLTEYISILLMNETWKFFEAIFNVPRDFVKELLYGVRDIRNALAHFRGDITVDQRDRLKFAVEWLTRRQEEYQASKQLEITKKAFELANQSQSLPQTDTPQLESFKSIPSDTGSTDFSVTESALGGGRYALLADWLQSQPGRIDKVQLTFNQIEEIIKTDLPPSARNYRVWWANDTVGHIQSQLWLGAGWRTTYINLSEGKVIFSRIREPEKAYITFFSKLLDELRKKSKFPVKNVSPDGASWIVVQTIPRNGPKYGSFTFSFSRDKSLRVELYLDLADYDQTKAAFDKLYDQKEQIEAQVGVIDWERLENRRASRIALYHDGYISDEKNHVELRKWAAEMMVKFYNVLLEPAEKAIVEAKNV